MGVAGRPPSATKKGGGGRSGNRETHAQGEEDMSQILKHKSYNGASTIILDDGTKVFKDQNQDTIVVVYDGWKREVLLSRSAATHPILSRPEITEQKVDGFREMSLDEESEYERAFDGTGWR